MGKMYSEGQIEFDFEPDLWMPQITAKQAHVLALEDGSRYLADVTTHDKILFLGRVKRNGEADTAFGNNGWLTTSFDEVERFLFSAGNLIRREPAPNGNERGVIASCSSFVEIGLACYNPDGSLDPSFGLDGTGKILHKLGAEKSLSNNGQVCDPIERHQSTTRYPFGLVPGSNGKMYAFLSRFERRDISILIRFMPDGTLDKTFNETGFTEVETPVAHNQVSGLIATSDGGVIVAGTLFSNRIGTCVFLGRYDERGKPVKSFGNSDTGFAVFTSQSLGIPPEYLRFMFLGSMALTTDEDGHEAFIAVGDHALRPASIYEGFVIAVNRFGKLLASFNGGRPLIWGISGLRVDLASGGVLVQQDGKILVGGMIDRISEQEITEVFLVRFHRNGTLDSGFGDHGLKRFATSELINYIRSMTLDAEQKPLVVIAVGPTRWVDAQRPVVVQFR